MDSPCTIANANENDSFEGRFYYSRDRWGHSNMHRLKFRPIAQKMIEKYWESPYKAYPKSGPYQHLELVIVLKCDTGKLFYNPSQEHRGVRIQALDWIAKELGVNPIRLYNDPDLPVYLRP